MRKKIVYPFKIRILAKAGSGIRFISYALAKLFYNKKKEVVLIEEFGSAVTDGFIWCDIIISDKPIECTYSDLFDIEVLLSKPPTEQNAKIFICDSSFRFYGNAIKKPFHSLAESALGNKKYANTLAMGYLLKFMHLDVTKTDFTKYFHSKKNENEKAVKIGYSL